MRKLLKLAVILSPLSLTAGVSNCDQQVFVGCEVPELTAQQKACFQQVTTIPKGKLTRAQLVELNATLRRSELRLARCGLNRDELYEKVRRHCSAQKAKRA